MSDYVYGLNKSGLSVIKLLYNQKKNFDCWDDNKKIRHLANKNIPKLSFKKINQKKMKKAIILLSGGLDSATCLSIAMNLGYECFGLSFDYGQRHKFELDCAKKLAKHYKIAGHKIMKIDLRSFGGSALTADIEVPKHRNIDLQKDQIPITYVPARNTIFLSFALFKLFFK